MNTCLPRLLPRLVAMIFIMAAFALPTSALAYDDCNDASMVGAGNVCVESPMENAGGVARTVFNAGKNQEAALAFFGALHDAWLKPAFAIAGGILGIFILITLSRAAFGAPGGQVFPLIIGGILYISLAMWPVDAQRMTPRMAEGSQAALGAVLIYRTADLAETYIKTNTRHWADGATAGGTRIPVDLALRVNPPSIRGLSTSPSVPSIINDYQNKCRVVTKREANDKLTKEDQDRWGDLRDFDLQNVGLLGFGTLGREPLDYAGEVTTWDPGIGLAKLTNITAFSEDAASMDVSRNRARAALRRIDNGSPYSPFNDSDTPYKVPSKEFWERYIVEVDQKGRPPDKVIPREDEYMTMEQIATALGVPEERISHPMTKRMLDGEPTGPFDASTVDAYGAYAYNCDQMFGLAHLAVGNYGKAYREVFTVEAEGTLRGGRDLSLHGKLSTHQAMIDSLDALQKTFDNGTNLTRENSAISGDADARQSDQGALARVWNMAQGIGGASASDPKSTSLFTGFVARVWLWYKDFQAEYWLVGVVGIFSIIIGLWYALFPILVPISFISARPWEMLFKQVAGIFFLKVSIATMYMIVLLGNILALTITQARALEPLNGMGHIDDLAPLILISVIGIPFLALSTMAITGWLILGSMRGISQMSDNFFGAGQIMKGATMTAAVATAPFGGIGKVAASAGSAALAKAGAAKGTIGAALSSASKTAPPPTPPPPTATPPSAPPALPSPSGSPGGSPGGGGGAPGGRPSGGAPSRPPMTFNNPPQDDSLGDLGGKKR